MVRRVIAIAAIAVSLAMVLASPLAAGGVAG
jgi:hypothetical protein